MYRNICYNYKKGTIWCSGWDKFGNRTIVEEPYKPYLYTKTEGSGDAVSIYEEPLRKLEFPDPSKRRDYVKANLHTYFNLPIPQQYLIGKYSGMEQTDDFSKFPLSIYFIDIEVFASDHFPSPLEARDPITVITVYSTLEQRFHVFGQGVEYFTKDEDVIYHYFSDELSMIKGFIRWWRKDFPDIVSGWYSQGYDIPYICNRINKLYGEEYACARLSPVNKAFHKEDVTKRYGAVERVYDQIWTIEGVTHIDMQAAYYKFSPHKLESYSLNSVCAFEGLGQKLEYEGSLADLWLKDPQTYIDYNVQDVRLLVRLEDKLKYMQLCRHMAYSALTQLSDSLSTIPIVTGLIALEALTRNRIISSFDNSDAVVSFEGGYVAEPKVGFARDIVSIDANSLYPSVIRTLNISNETKVGWVDFSPDKKSVTVRLVSGKSKTFECGKLKDFLKAADVAVSPNGVMFSQKKQGIIPALIERLYMTRKKTKKEMLSLEKQASEMERMGKDPVEIEEIRSKADFLNIRQWLAKIQLNSIYGFLGEKHSALFDMDLATTVTAMGRETIKKTAELVNTRASEIMGENVDVGLYIDTDSCTGDTKINVNGSVIDIGWFYEVVPGNLTVDDDKNKNYVKNVNGDYFVRCSDGETVKRGKIKYVMKHTVKKQMFKIKVDGKEVVITKDHSVMVKRDGKMVSVKPCEIKKTDKLICVDWESL